MSSIDEVRRHWGTVFSELRTAGESVNAAWYHAEDKQTLKVEDIQRWQALIKQAQKAIADWESR